jgi:hypothetical protein
MRRLPSRRLISSLALVGACGTQDKAANAAADTTTAVAGGLDSFATGGLDALVVVETK